MRHSNEFYQKLTEAIDHGKSFGEMIPIFNKELIKYLKNKECYYCRKQIIGKGFTVHDTFGEVDLNFCNRECADNYHIRDEA